MSVLYFDGYCALCNGLVDRLMRWDHARQLRVASLQGVTARERLPLHLQGRVETVVFEHQGQFYVASTAVIRSLTFVCPRVRFLNVLLWLPESWRDWVYAWVAHRRYRWFGRLASCRLPQVHERERFLE